MYTLRRIKPSYIEGQKNIKDKEKTKEKDYATNTGLFGLHFKYNWFGCNARSHLSAPSSSSSSNKVAQSPTMGNFLLPEQPGRTTLILWGFWFDICIESLIQPPTYMVESCLYRLCTITISRGVSNLRNWNNLVQQLILQSYERHDQVKLKPRPHTQTPETQI